MPLPKKGEVKRAILETYTKEYSAEYQSQALIDVAKKLKTIVTAMQALKTKELPPEEKYLLSALSHTVSKL